MRRVIFLSWILVLGSWFFTGCRIQKDVSTTSERQERKEEGSSTSIETNSVDSLFSSLSFEADSIVIVAVKKPANNNDTTANAVVEESRITIHQPKINQSTQQNKSQQVKEERKDSTLVKTAQADSTSVHKDIVGVAEPLNLDWLIIAIALILIGAIVLLLWLRKKKII